MEILIGSDVVPTATNSELFKTIDTTSLLGNELHTIWNLADVRIFNLETPICEVENKIPKAGPNFIAPPNTINGIKGLNPSLVTLANNHIFDQGEQGLFDTMHLLNKYKIAYVGAGKNVDEANKPFIINKHGLKIGIYTCADNEFSIATDKTPGANPFDPLESLDHIYNLKEQCDYVIVLYHGGKEYYRYPSPHLQKICRKMVKKGADLVICQHSHCIGSYEEYNSSTIIYGQGNFIFNKYSNEFWNTGLLVRIKVDKALKVDYIPIVKVENRVRLAKDKEAEEILTAFQKRSNEILIPEFVEQKYTQLAKEVYLPYMGKISGFGKWLSRLDRFVLRGTLLNLIFDKKKLLSLQNIIECEAHRELVLKSIKEKRS